MTQASFFTTGRQLHKLEGMFLDTPADRMQADGFRLAAVVAEYLGTPHLPPLLNVDRVRLALGMPTVNNLYALVRYFVKVQDPPRNQGAGVFGGGSHREVYYLSIVRVCPQDVGMTPQDDTDQVVQRLFDLGLKPIPVAAFREGMVSTTWGGSSPEGPVFLIVDMGPGEAPAKQYAVSRNVAMGDGHYLTEMAIAASPPDGWKEGDWSILVACGEPRKEA